MYNNQSDMNIFMLHMNTEENVKLHCDKHVVKMILEYAQMLSTAHRLIDGTFGLYIDEKVYRATHDNHPCTIWVRDNCANYRYMYDLFSKLCEEYTYRYGKEHLTWTKLGRILSNPPENIPHASMADIINMPQAMPEEYKDLNVVSAYRNYYKGEKAGFAKYTKRETPDWL